MLEILSVAYPIYACVSYLSAMILLFLDLKGVPVIPPLELKITMNPFEARGIWAYVSPLPISDLRLRIFST
jgi:hypothetical protein